MSLLDQVTETLGAAGIPNALIGAMALAAYGVNRSSADIDLLAADARCLTRELWIGLESRGVQVRIRKGERGF